MAQNLKGVNAKISTKYLDKQTKTRNITIPRGIV